MLIRALVCGAMALARLVELGYSRRNLRAWPDAMPGVRSRSTYPYIVLVHVVDIGGTFLFGSPRPRLAFLTLLLAVQPLRAWVLLTLGRRWNTLAAVPQTMELATNGPYAFVRHPNYSVLVVEMAMLPATFGLKRLAVAGALAMALLLALRIPEEEAMLSHLPGHDRLAAKPRFIPFLI